MLNYVDIESFTVKYYHSDNTHGIYVISKDDSIETYAIVCRTPKNTPFQIMRFGLLLNHEREIKIQENFNFTLNSPFNIGPVGFDIDYTVNSNDENYCNVISGDLKSKEALVSIFLENLNTYKLYCQIETLLAKNKMPIFVTSKKFKNADDPSKKFQVCISCTPMPTISILHENELNNHNSHGMDDYQSFLPYINHKWNRLVMLVAPYDRIVMPVNVCLEFINIVNNMNNEG